MNGEQGDVLKEAAVEYLSYFLVTIRIDWIKHADKQALETGT
jgi:hypothetical protein